MKTIPWNKANNQIPVKNSEARCALSQLWDFLFVFLFYVKIELFTKFCIRFVIFCINLSLRENKGIWIIHLQKMKNK